MNELPNSPRRCPACGQLVSALEAAFCGNCGAPLSSRQPLQEADVENTPVGEHQVLAKPAAVTAGAIDQAERRPRKRKGPMIGAFTLLGVLIAGLVGAFIHLRASENTQLDRLSVRIDRQAQQLQVLQEQNSSLGKRITNLRSRLSKQGQGLAPLANRILRSVFTVDSGTELGSAWVAWQASGESYLITANHVVADAVAVGDRSVTVHQKGRTFSGRVVRTDPTNDLALVQVKGRIAPALWQKPRLDVAPVVGDQLLLVGSPYGLEGTVTQGVVSRVTYDAIQTDAAANPGNSGGPAVDRDGQIVGVLLSGGAQNLNFAAPIQRVCVSLRRCR